MIIIIIIIIYIRSEYFYRCIFLIASPRKQWGLLIIFILPPIWVSSSFSSWTFFLFFLLVQLFPTWLNLSNFPLSLSIRSIFDSNKLIKQVRYLPNYHFFFLHIIQKRKFSFFIIPISFSSFFEIYKINGVNLNLDRDLVLEWCYNLANNICLSIKFFI